eukprot:502413-Rhodomonas_salina.1
MPDCDCGVWRRHLHAAERVAWSQGRGADCHVKQLNLRTRQQCLKFRRPPLQNRVEETSVSVPSVPGRLFLVCDHAVFLWVIAESESVHLVGLPCRDECVCVLGGRTCSGCHRTGLRIVGLALSSRFHFYGVLQRHSFCDEL